jgi:hypothetical protein
VPLAGSAPGRGWERTISGDKVPKIILTAAEALLLHRILAEYHRKIADTPVATKHDYHDDLCWRLEHEADRLQDEIVMRL